MAPTLTEWLVFFVIPFGVAGACLGQTWGRAVAGAALGATCGPLGLLLLFGLPSGEDAAEADAALPERRARG